MIPDPLFSIMDLERVRAYLQVACAGLGFDVGEIWWTCNEHGTAASEDGKQDSTNYVQSDDNLHQPKFVQLYTSKSFEEKRSMLVNPPEDEKKDEHNYDHNQHSTKSNVEKHVLSPLLVDAISKTAQVVWANTKKQEGLLGRSDMLLQTAVGMPVAVDANGNMCVVVMFSPRNIQSNDDAVDYLKSISQGATSSNIPCLLPAFDPKAGLITPHHDPVNDVIPLLASSSITDGITTQFVSLEHHVSHCDIGGEGVPDSNNSHELFSAPKDCFGIPMLPAFAELEGTGYAEKSGTPSSISDAFDEASYGVWSTIMENPGAVSLPELDPILVPAIADHPHDAPHSPTTFSNQPEPPVFSTVKAQMSRQRRDRLEEFATAFLDVSVFDVAEVWVPTAGSSDYLGHVASIYSSNQGQSIKEFGQLSQRVLIKYWSGAVGRAFSSGNPVWSTNRSVFVDSGRADIFDHFKIQTSLAVPVFSGKSVTPSCIFCCYSFVRTGSVPFVLRFVQQALRLLWKGLDQVEPHESVGRELWRNVAPADLGEMAADVEMQQHFISKKRPRDTISDGPLLLELTSAHEPNHRDSPDFHSTVPSSRSIYTGKVDESPPLNPTQPPNNSAIVYPSSTLNNSNDSRRAQIINAVQSVAPVPQFPTNGQGYMITHDNKRVHLSNQSMMPSSPQFHPTPHTMAIIEIPNAILHQPQTHQHQQQHHQQPQQQQPRFQQPMAQHKSASSSTLQQPIAPHQYNTVAASPLPPPRPLAMPGPILMTFPPNSAPTFNNHLQANNAQFAPAQPLQTAAPAMQLNNSDNDGQSNTLPHTSNLQTTSYACQQQQQQPQQQPQQMPQMPQLQGVQGAATHHPQMDHHTETAGFAYATPQTIHSVNQGSVNGQMVQNNFMDQGSGNSIMYNATNMAFCQTVHRSDGSLSASAVSNKHCRIQGCDQLSVVRRPYCVRHSGNRMCEHNGCSKCAQGSTRFCIAHGGGRRCTHEGCDKGARDKFFCAAHGGGKRCKFDGCSKSAVGGSSLCTAHGGGKRCTIYGCDKSAQSSTKFCVKHGGGKKCSHPDCEKVARGRTQYCAAHGGGVRCKLAGCRRVSIGKHQLCRAHGGGSKSMKTQA